MAFWKGWALWQKLSVALAFLLALVLVYSFSVLTYNRRKIRKHANEEANQRAEQEAEMGEVGSEATDIPFGARALEKGIEVEGIWTMKGQSLAKQPSLTEKNRNSVLSAFIRPKSTASSVQTPQIIEPDSKRTSATGESQAESVLESVHIDTFRSSRPPKLDIGGHGHGGPKSSDYERPLSRGWFASRSSWMKPIVGYRRMSVRDGRHRRTSSEDFRRRFSKLFDETLPPGPPRPTEMFQLTPIYQESVDSLGKESLDKTTESVAAN
ncbi:hypothetical protein BJY01DRAFT_222681 [Aspergillus pseudoustus]|uniref:Uncharacterized protein n=1 Tax=Aspergillus pseudoustus TaxID=1810923 RepID=A0ABR4J7S4_9EURO